MKRIASFSLWIGCLTAGSGVLAAPPRLFFSDMIDGPVSGWEASATKGAAVSIWGVGFGTTRGSSSVTVCGVTLDENSDFAEWAAFIDENSGDPADDFISARGLQRTTFFLNSAMTTGPGTIRVTTSEGQSETIPFHCRSLGTNKIYFVAPGGSDSNNGLHATDKGSGNGPRQTMRYIRPTDGLKAGDIAYFRTGVWTAIDDHPNGWSGNDCVVEFWSTNHNNGTANKSITIAAYPGEIATLGSASRSCVFFHHGGDGDHLAYWTFSKFKLRGADSVTDWGGSDPGSDDNLRFIGNDISTTAGGKTAMGFSGQDGGQTNFYFYGNHGHDVGVDNRVDGPALEERGYPLYFNGYGKHNHIYVGWNEFSYNGAGRGMQLYGHKDGDSIDNVYIHDNWIHHNGLTGAILGGTDASSNAPFVKTVWFYNNIVAHNGDDGFPAIKLGGSNQVGGKFYIFNNVLYHNDSEIYTHEGGTPELIVIKNNLIVPASGKSYFIGHTSGSFFSGSNNLYYGDGNGPDWDQNRLDNVNPQFLLANPQSHLDFRLQPTSPAINAGVAVAPVTRDFLGAVRTVMDIGAYEHDGGELPTEPPQPPATVNVN